MAHQATAAKAASRLLQAASPACSRSDLCHHVQAPKSCPHTPVARSLRLTLVVQVTTTVSKGPSDKFGPILIEYLPASCPRISPVGRLDFESEGLILLTNDTRLQRIATQPGCMRKTYRVLVQRRRFPYDNAPPSAEELSAMVTPAKQAGLVLQAVGAALVDAYEGRALVDLELLQGKKHEVRRILAAAGFSTIQLIRIQIGSVSAGCKPTSVQEALIELEQLYPGLDVGQIYKQPAPQSRGMPQEFVHPTQLLAPGRSRLLTPHEIDSLFSSQFESEPPVSLK